MPTCPTLSHKPSKPTTPNSPPPLSTTAKATRGISNAFYSYLEYIRARVLYSNGMSGSYVDLLSPEFVSPYLIVTDARAYSMIDRLTCARRKDQPLLSTRRADGLSGSVRLTASAFYG